MDLFQLIKSRAGAGVTPLLKSWIPLRLLGMEGKDGLVVHVRSVTDPDKEGAVKVFKASKPSVEIEAELRLCQILAAAGAGPAILDHGKKFFVMVKLKRTLRQVVDAQHGRLTVPQVEDLTNLLGARSKAVFVADPSVGRNIMENDDGKFLLIDCGAGREPTSADFNQNGPWPNYGLLGCIQSTLRVAGAPFSEAIRAYEEENAVRIVKGRVKMKDFQWQP